MVGPYMRPETHFRIGLNLLPHRRRDDDQYTTTEVNALMRSGMVHAIGTTYSRDREFGTGTMEARGHGPTREYRFPGGTHLCSTCGAETGNVLASTWSACPSCQQKARAAQARAIGLRNALPLHTCPWCDRQFRPIDRMSKYCSRTCSDQSRRKVQ